jgi:hypothetical protein
MADLPTIEEPGVALELQRVAWRHGLQEAPRG